MSEPHEDIREGAAEPMGDEVGPSSLDGVADDEADAALRALVKRSLTEGMPEPPPAQDFLRGVQKRIRQRARSRFYAEGLSTLQNRVNYGLIALLVLVLVVLAYVAIGPLGFGRP